MWQLLDSGLFLRNVSFESFDLPMGSGYGYNVGHSGETGGSATHNHDLNGHHAYACCGFGDQIGYPTWFYTAREADTPTFYTLRGGIATDAGQWQTTVRGASVRGRTEDASTLPPYMTVYCWQRTA